MKILVPLKVPLDHDLAKVGIRLAKDMEAELGFLNVADTRPVRGYIRFPEETIDLMKKDGKAILKGASDLAEKEGVEAETLIETGIPCEETLKKSEDVDIIVIGKRHFSSFGIIGSVTKNVIVNSKKSIFVFEREQEKFDKVLVAIDGSRYSKRVLEYALYYAELLGLKSISAIFVAKTSEDVEEGEKVLKEASKTCEQSNVELNTHLKEGDPATEILKMDDKDYNMIILSATGKHSITRLFWGSVSRKVIVFSHCGVIIVPHCG